jgi:hypothetical protein
MAKYDRKAKLRLMYYYWSGYQSGKITPKQMAVLVGVKYPTMVKLLAEVNEDYSNYKSLCLMIAKTENILPETIYVSPHKTELLGKKVLLKISSRINFENDEGMILGFKHQFVEPIDLGIKKHSLREDPTGRWIKDRKIHYATDVRTTNMNIWRVGVCTGVQKIEISHFFSNKGTVNELHVVNIHVDGRKLNQSEINQLAINDGFPDFDSFLEWFNSDWSGKIVHWTDLRY